MRLQELPIDDHLDEIRATVERHGAAIIVASPGAGKTTRIPPQLLERGRLLLLQPRRAAARSLARRIAYEQGWTLGREIGWHIRHERKFSSDSRLIVMTEGMLLARLIQDPLLSDTATVVLDEFHERSLDLDLAIALLRTLREVRPELRVVVMSATLDAAPVAQFLGDAPVLEVEGRAHPLEIVYRPQAEPTDAIRREWDEAEGNLLAFFPGAPEIERARRTLTSRLPGVPIIPLYGALDSRAQDLALSPSADRRIILATNLAETSLTVPGVRSVVDSGYHKTPRLDLALGLDRLETERISRDAADQRAGRAARLGPGRCVRLWDERDELRAHREPEVHRVDLSAAVLNLIVSGETAESFVWYERPTDERLQDAIQLLTQLGALAGESVSEIGKQMRRLPLPPRLARILVGTGLSLEATRGCAALAEGWRPAQPLPASDNDLLAVADRFRSAPESLRRVARDLERRQSELNRSVGEPESFSRALFVAYGDRLARRRTSQGKQFQLRNGHGVVQDELSGVRNADWIVAIEMRAARRGRAESSVSLAASVDPAWIEPGSIELLHEIDGSSGRVRAWEVEKIGAIEIQRRVSSADPDEATALLYSWMRRRDLSPLARTEWNRIRMAGLEIDQDDLLRQACAQHDRGFDWHPLQTIDPTSKHQVQRLAPESIVVPSGRRARLEYRDDGAIVMAVKLQELFGLRESPTVGRQKIPLTISLLAPNGRPVQTTQDLKSFWENGYPEVRKQLRGRYAKHPWPEDPLSALPTARAKPRKR
jgi:ATP-dependent helicase HrpB